MLYAHRVLYRPSLRRHSVMVPAIRMIMERVAVLGPCTFAGCKGQKAEVAVPCVMVEPHSADVRLLGRGRDAADLVAFR